MSDVSGISVIIIAKNEEQRIVRAIQSTPFAHEIIVVDNGSTDATSSIAKKLGCRVVSVSSDDFSKIRSEGMKEAGYEWILYLDADEEVTEELREEIIRVIEGKGLKIKDKGLMIEDDDKDSESLIIHHSSLIHGYFIPRRNFFLGREWPTPDKQIRLFRKKYLRGWTGRVHETAIVDGEIGLLTNYMDHHTHRSLSEMVEKTNEWSQIEAKLRFDSNHPAMSWWRMFRVMMTSFFDYYIVQKGYTAGMVGIIESIYQSFSTFITYAKLWEMQKNMIKD